MNIIAHLFENQLIISILYKKECKGQYRTSFWSEFCIRIAAMIIIQQEPELAHLCYRRRWAHRLVYATLFFSATKKSHGIQNQAKNHFQMLEADQSQGVFEGGKVPPTPIRIQDYPFLDGKLIDLLGLVGWPPWFSKTKLTTKTSCSPGYPIWTKLCNSKIVGNLVSSQQKRSQSLCFAGWTSRKCLF